MGITRIGNECRPQLDRDDMAVVENGQWEGGEVLKVNVRKGRLLDDIYES